jgi:hypothetical protein
VMRMANTPSLNASRRALFIAAGYRRGAEVARPNLLERDTVADSPSR